MASFESPISNDENELRTFVRSLVKSYFDEPHQQDVALEAVIATACYNGRVEFCVDVKAEFLRITREICTNPAVASITRSANPYH